MRKKPESLVRSATEAEAGRKGVTETQPEPSEGPAVDGGPDSKEESMASDALLGGVTGAEDDEPEDEPAEGDDDDAKSAKYESLLPKMAELELASVWKPEVEVGADQPNGVKS